MRTVPIVCALVAAILGPAAAQQPAAQPSQKLSSYDRGLSLVMLKEAKRDLLQNYYDPSFHGLNVDAVFAEAEAKIRAAQSVAEVSAILADPLLRLDDSHTVFFPPPRLTRVDYGWSLEIVGDAAYVTFVKKGSDAEAKGLQRGDRVLAWNRFEPNRSTLWQLRYVYRYVRPQQLQRLVVRKPSGEERVLDIESSVERRPIGDLEELIREAEDSSRDVSAVVKPAGDALVVRLAWFGDPHEIDDAMKRTRGYKSLVLDLRGNPGGRVDAITALVSWCFDHDVTVSVEKTRKGESREITRGRKDALKGPIVVLIDAVSASASEITARVLQIEKRATVIGDRSAGAVMTSRHFAHTLGGDLGGVGWVAFYGTSITVADVRMSDGGALEKVGVAPDEVVLPSAADLAAGRDPALARALVLAGTEITAEAAGRFYR